MKWEYFTAALTVFRVCGICHMCRLVDQLAVALFFIVPLFLLWSKSQHLALHVVQQDELLLCAGFV